MSVEPAKCAIVPQAAKASVEGQLASLAYQLWQQRGRPEGSPEEDWSRAQELMGTLQMRSLQAQSHDDWRTRLGGAGSEHEIIAAKAHELWTFRGCPIGSPGIDWREAQSELKHHEALLESTIDHRRSIATKDLERLSFFTP
jgi:hypothetical protein